MNKIIPSSNAITQQPQQTVQQPVMSQPNISSPSIEPPEEPIPSIPLSVDGSRISPANTLFGGGSYAAQAAKAGIPGSVGGLGPQAGADATRSGLVAGTTAEANNEVARMDKMINADNELANNVPFMKLTLDKAKDARSRLHDLQKGGVFGHAPAVTTAANDYDSAMNTIAAQWAKADSQGNLTNLGREMALQAKSPRNVTDEAFDHMYAYNDGLQDRVAEKPLFNTTLKNLGYTSQQIPILWNYYQTKKPFYDAKNHEKASENLNMWEDFYSNKKNLNAAFSPKAQKEIDKFINPTKSKHTTEYVTIGGTKYHYVNGKYYQ
jgi:hypothetical protein